MKEKIKAFLEEEVRQKTFAGAVFGYVDLKGESWVLPVGKRTYEPNATKVEADFIFDCASITKTCPTNTLALMALDSGMLTLESPISLFLPEFQPKQSILFKHLLTHTLDFRFSMSGLKDCTPDEIWNFICNYEMQFNPGEGYCYCNATSIVLTKVLEKLYSQDLDEIAHQKIFEPLAMNRSGFKPLSSFSESEIMPTEECSWRSQILCGVVHDESAFTLSQERAVGAAGLFSTVPDLLSFVKNSLRSMASEEDGLLSTKLAQITTKNQIEGIGLSVGLGWEKAQQHYMGQRFMECVGKTGFTGCHLQINHENLQGIVFLSNYTYPKRKDSPKDIHRVRRWLADAIWS